MALLHVKRYECDRCGFVWTGDDNPDVTELMVRKGDDVVLGKVKRVRGAWQYWTWAVLCGDCAADLIPWLKGKKWLP